MIFFTLASLVSFYSGTHQESAPQSDYMTLTGKTLGTHPGGVKNLCDMDAVGLSPTASYLVFSRAEFSATTLVPNSQRLVIASTPCIAAHGMTDGCMTTIEGLRPPRPVSWGLGDESLVLAENLENLVELRVARNANPLWMPFMRRVPMGKALGAVLSGFDPATPLLRDPALLEAARRAAGRTIWDKATPETTIQLLVDGRHFASIRHDNPTLGGMVRIDGETAALPMPAPFLKFGAFSHGPGGTWHVSGLGVQFMRHGKAWRAVDMPLFSRALISSRSGQLLGSYALRNVRFSVGGDKSRRAQSAIMQLLRDRPSAMLWRLSADERGNYALVLKNLDGSASFHASIRGHALRHECGKAESASPAAIRIVQAGSPQWPLGLIELSPSAPRGVVAFFRGGPTGDPANETDNKLVRQYLARGWAVLLAGYSGTVGSGVEVSTRLKAKGPDALRQDAQAIARYIDTTYPRLPVIAHGESFGAGSAIALDSLMRGRAGGLVGMVPYLKSRPATEWLQTEELFAGDLNRQPVFERATIGVSDENRAAFNAALSELAKGRDPSRPAFFLFGSLDRASRPGDLPQAYCANTRILTVQATHRFAESDELNGEVDRWMASLEGSKQPPQVTDGGSPCPTP